MRQRRFLAPWHQGEMMEKGMEGLEEGLRLLREAELRARQGRPAIYHCLSRVVDRRRTGNGERGRALADGVGAALKPEGWNRRG